jgi:hypothetical protein
MDAFAPKSPILYDDQTVDKFKFSIEVRVHKPNNSDRKHCRLLLQPSSSLLINTCNWKAILMRISNARETNAGLKSKSYLTFTDTS